MYPTFALWYYAAENTHYFFSTWTESLILIDRHVFFIKLLSVIRFMLIKLAAVNEKWNIFINL